MLHRLQHQQIGRSVFLVMDEMYVKVDLVYKKDSGELVGFANVGATNDQLLQFQRDLYRGWKGGQYAHSG